jgi:DNA mismatch endonuclease (patch repair protein)
VVFRLSVDGWFWHSCPVPATVPKANADYWIPKLKDNVARDRRSDRERNGRRSATSGP